MKQFFNPKALFGGGKKTPRVVQVAPEVVPEDTAADEARRKELAEAEKRKGRRRSLLSGTQTVGEGDVSKPSLLGGI